MPRKPRVDGVTVERVVDFVKSNGVTTSRQVAECFDIAEPTARRRLDGAVYRGLLVEDDHDEEGHRLMKPDWRYIYDEDYIAEMRAYDAQEQYIKENFGEEADAHANYGWGVDTILGYICTKVYGHGVLTTDIKTLEHEFEPF